MIKQSPDSRLKTRNITLDNGLKGMKVAVSEILFVQAEHVYIRIYLSNNRKVLHRNSLGSFIKKLPAGDFVQVHRSYIVNSSHISKRDKEQLNIHGHIIPISRSRRKQVNQRLFTC